MADEPLGRMIIELGLDDSEFGKGLQGAQRKAKYAMAEMKSNMSFMSAWGNQTQVLQTKMTGLSRAIEAQAGVVKKQREQFENSRTKLGEATGATGKYATQLQNATAKLNSLQGQLRKTAGELAVVKTQTQGITGVMNKVGTAATAIGGKLSSIGKTATTGFTIPIAAGLGYAAKSAIDFNSQIASLGPLLTNGEAVTGRFKTQLNQLSESSLKWSKQYGLSTTEINDAMSELVKRGYNASQVIGALPSILDATKASGEGMGTVMQATASIVEQFGLTSKTTAGAMKNTQLVTDSLTYAANATAAGFGDLSEAMSFVGPVAHSLGLSVQETAAAIGALSQQGIEGQKAGTGLRGILTSLIKPTKSQDEAFRSMGISAKRLQEDSHNLPQLIDDIQKGTAHASKAERGRALALAFGKQQQSAANALVEFGSSKLRELTKATNESGGATKRVADQLNDTQANKIKRFQSSLQALAISFGQKLLPTLMPITESLTDLINKFSELDSGTQQVILKTALAVAAFGPLNSVLGGMSKVFGGLNTGYVKMASSIAKFAATHRQLSDVTEALGGLGSKATSTDRAFKPLGDTVGKTVGKFTVSGSAASIAGDKLGEAANVATKAGGSFTLFGKALTVGAGEAGVLGTALTPLGAGIIAVGLAAAGAVTWWELSGKKAMESAGRAQEWGSDIGEAADKSAGKMKDASGKISGAFNDTNNSVRTNAKTIVSGFDSITKAAKGAAKESDSAAKSLASQLGGEAGKALLAVAAKEKTANDKRIKQLQENAKLSQSITADANKRGVQLTSDQVQVLNNLRQDSAAQAVKTLSLSGKQQNNVLKAILGERVSMSKASAEKQYSDMQYALQDEYQANTRAQNEIKNNALLSTSEKNATLLGLEKDHQAKLDVIYQGAIQSLKAQGYTNKQVQQQMQDEFDLTAYQAKNAMNAYTQSMSKGINSSKQFAAAVSEGMSKSVIKAGKDWNSLVLDPKTGKVITNLPEVLKQTASTKDGWERLKFDLKHAKVSTNAKQTMAEALASSSRWNYLSFEEKEAIIRSTGRKELAGVFDQFVRWDKLTLKEQQAVVKGDYTPLVNVLIKANQWNQLTLKQKQAVVNTKQATPLIDALALTEKWNGLTLVQKNAIINAKGKPELVDAIFQAGVWDSMTIKDQEALIRTKGVPEFVNALKAQGTWNGLDVKEKAAIVNTRGTQDLAGLLVKYGGWQEMPDVTKRALMNDTGFWNSLSAMMQGSHTFSATEIIKWIKANSTDFQNGLNTANAAAETFGQTPAKKPIDADTKPLDTKFKNLFNPNYFGSKAATIPVDANTANADSKIKQTKANAGGKVTLKVDPKNSIETISSVASAIKKVPNRKPDINVNGHDSKSKAEGIHRAIKGIPNRNPDVNLNGHGSREKAAGIRDTIRQIPVRKDSDIYITTHKTTITETRHKRAGGDDNFVGGDAIVNDQKGSTFRELIHLPNGRAFIPRGRNVLLKNLPRATKIVPAPTTAKMFKGLPQFANGLNIPANATPVRMVRDLTDRIANSGTNGLSIAQSIVAGNTDNNNGKLIDEMVKANAMLKYIITLLTPMSSGTDTPAPININQFLRALASAMGPYSHYISANSKRTGGLI